LRRQLRVALSEAANAVLMPLFEENALHLPSRLGGHCCFIQAKLSESLQGERHRPPKLFAPSLTKGGKITRASQEHGK
jgi:hypothetical protein